MNLSIQGFFSLVLCDSFVNPDTWNIFICFIYVMRFVGSFEMIKSYCLLLRLYVFSLAKECNKIQTNLGSEFPYKVLAINIQPEKIIIKKQKLIS